MRGRHFLFTVFFSTVFFLSTRASHNRAGEITYRRIDPTTVMVGGTVVQVYNYSITLITYTDHGPNITDKMLDTIYFGDGSKGPVLRTNGTPTCGDFYNGIPVPCGEVIIDEAGYVVKKNIYSTTHTYGGAGSFLIRTFDPNRNAGVLNIPKSEEQPFYVESLLIINSFSGANSSPLFHYLPIDRACFKECFTHSPGAYDPDGDSLSFKITSSKGVDGLPVTGYSFPATGSPGRYDINPKSGILTWCSPQLQGEYNLAFVVEEWRKNTSDTFELIGYVLRDMQVIVKPCNNNKPPAITVPADICVEAGTTVTATILFSDPNENSIITIEGGGGPFDCPDPKATLSPTSVNTFTNPGGSSASFEWKTKCDHIRQQPYLVTIKAQDMGPVIKLSTYNTFNIRLYPPSVKNVTAFPLGSRMKISWTPSSCSPTNNPLIGYKIYRKDDCQPFVHDPCDNGIPESSGFVLVGQTNGSTAFFVDDNSGNGLVVGQDYSYLVVAAYGDGCHTYGSAPVCAKLRRDVPLLLNVDVTSTSPNEGTVLVRWANPLISPGNLDTLVFTGPYKFSLNEITQNGSVNTIKTITEQYFKPFVTNPVQQFLHQNINTTDLQHEYVVAFEADTAEIGSSQKASSIFLSSTASDRQVDLKWESKTPWNNTSYTVYRKDQGSAAYSQIGTTPNTIYADSGSVSNGKTYCYYIRSEGAYSDPFIVRPLFNNSQELCVEPKDKTPPCTPNLTVAADCPTGFVKVSWNNVKKDCWKSDDVSKYILYYKPTVDGPYAEVRTVPADEPLSFTYDGLDIISGCYAVRAIDINGNAGLLSPDFCIENCPEFELPNIFSPNGDGVNDFFKAIKVRQIRQINLNVFDRWGNMVFHTNDPDFKWNGVSNASNLSCSEGTFFYTCDVFEPRLTGTIIRILKGTVQLVR